MLKRTLLLFALLSMVATANAQLNLNLLGEYAYPPSRGDCSDIWGYVDGSGNEYAIVGNENGTSIMDLSDPTNPVEVFFTSGDQTIWRDMKVWGTTAYITNEGGGGLKIIDLSNLPGAITAADVYTYNGSTYPFSTAHNIFMDENGHAYILGANNGVGGAIILDVNPPNQFNPVELGRYNDYYMHDVYVRGDTLWGGAIDDGFFTVVDVSDPMNCTTMATHFTPTTFSHNTWLSDDGNTLFTTDEVSNAYIAAYDVSDINNIVELDKIQSSPGQNVIPHNTFVRGNYIITSYYRDGITIHDVTNPANMIEVGNYDTSPAFAGDGFNGAWGVYPYLPSGNVIVSDIENGLVVLGPTYSPAAYLEGNITDANTTNPINNAQVEIVTTSLQDFSDASGDYVSGIGTGGTYDVTFSKLGYISETVTGVVLTNGQTTVVDVDLIPLVTFTLTGTVQDTSGTPLPGVQIEISDSQQTVYATTNGLGQFTLNSFLSGTYDLVIGIWGHHPICITGETFTQNGGPYVYQLVPGYSDNMELDLGWVVSDNPDTGDWERDVPNGTTYQGNPANPGDDSGDCGDMAWITGNGGGQAGSDDIDDGQTVLTSPVFDLTNYADPYLSFERWFFNAGGQGGAPNDSLVVELTNGTQTVKLDVAVNNDPNEGEWAAKEYRILDEITLSAFMQVKVRAMDEPSGHLVEGGFDNFLVWDSIVTIDDTGIEDLLATSAIKVYPVPFSDEITVEFEQSFNDIEIEVLELSSGKLVDVFSFAQTNKVQLQTDYAKGIYLIRVKGNDQLIAIRRVVKL